MRIRGIHYDAGTATVTGGITRPTLTADRAAADVALIADGLYANAVRVAGQDVARLELVGRLAGERELDVWLSPMLVNGAPDATSALIADAAEAAERLRRRGYAVTLVVGCELSAFLSGVIPGDGVLERLSLLSDPARLFPAIAAAGVDPLAVMGAFLADAAAAARTRFAGPVTYAAGTWEHVDWTLFDVVGVDAYRDATNRATFADELRALARHGRPVVVTETGCATFRGAADRGSLAWTVVDRSTDPPRLTRGVVRDEPGQAAELISLLDVLESVGVEGAFVYTFAAPSYPAADDPKRDLDAASFALVRTWPDGRAEPKAAFHAVARRFASWR